MPVFQVPCPPGDPGVSVIDTTTNAVVATLAPAAAAQLVVNPAGTRIYATGAGVLTVMDAVANTPITDISIGSAAAGSTR